MKKLIVLFSIIALLPSCKQKIKTCTVKSHNVTSDRAGNPTYNTVISCSDGSLRSKEGLRFYTMEIDTQFNDTCYCFYSK